jgi:septum formation protein
MHDFPPFILASKSPRRQYLLKESGFQFNILTKDVDESFPAELQREQVALYLASKKSDAFELEAGDILVTADTIVCLGEEVINKPEDEAGAYVMLRQLSGRMHDVFTGVSIRTRERKHSFYEQTSVFFRHLEEDEIDYYVRTHQPFDKAGAYGVQEWLGYIAVYRIEGCFYNVMGFPLAKFYQELKWFLNK